MNRLMYRGITGPE